LRKGKVLERFSGLRVFLASSLACSWRRSKKASIPSGLAGRAGGPGFGRAGNPTAPFKSVELLNPSEPDVEGLCAYPFVLLLMLLCVALLLCMLSAGFPADMLLSKLLLTLASNGPGAIVFILFKTLALPLVRGLSGANKGSASA